MREAAAFIEPLIEWFDRNGRDLPWRRRRSAYRALVSELMLQQTQVSRVAERFAAFMRRFPTLRALADADEQEVLAAWQGLGYYRRARHLHQAARIIVERHCGRVPRNADALSKLPGVGRYTAGAIASIIFDEPAPIVDGNVRRVLCRFFANDERDERAEDAWAWMTAGRLVQAASRPGEFNEALMELGATVCTPRNPRCGACPARGQCRAHAAGVELRIPAPKRAPARLPLHHHAVVIRRGDRVLMQRRPAVGLWANLWQTPTIEADRSLAEDDLAGQLPARVSGLTFAGEFTATLTHRRVHMYVYLARTRSRAGHWMNVAKLGALPLSSAHRRVLAVAGVTPIAHSRPA